MNFNPFAKKKKSEVIEEVMVSEPEPRREWNRALMNENDRRKSELCKAKDVHTNWYRRWCSEIRETPRYHRKQWEYVYVLQALWERDCLVEGKRGLVFAVGSESLPAVIAGYGCEVVATDLFVDQGLEKGWDNGAQLCFGLDSLYKPDIIQEDVFRARVQYEPVDMNAIPDHLRGFDFNWSSCSFEHLGSIEKGLIFLKNQLKTLKPGGWAVHTTEFNLSSNDRTQDDNDTVLFRMRDLEKLAAELRAEGHFVEELDYSLGGLPEDFQVDIWPYEQNPHIRLQIGEFVVASIGLIIRKGGA
jgi:hypothetical protein